MKMNKEKKRFRKLKSVLGFALLLAIIQAGCAAKSIPEEPDALSALPISAKAYFLSGYANLCPSGQGDNMLYVTSTVSVFNPENGFSPMLLCSQPGCSHSDETCKAYIGNRNHFMCYQGVWYWTVAEDSRTIAVKSYDYESGKRQDMFRFTTAEGSECIDQYMIAENNFLYLLYDEVSSNPDKASYDITRRIEKIHIRSGSHETVMESGGAECWLEGAWKENVIYTRTYINGEFPDLSSGQIYQEEIAVTDQMYVTELRMRRKNGSDVLIADQIRTVGNHPFKDSVFVYIDGEYAKIYEIITGEAAQADFMHPLSVSIFDGKLFMNAKDQNGAFHYEITDLNNLSSHKALNNNGITEHIAFNIISETENGFFGQNEEGFGWIRKEDLYVGRYNKVVSLGRL